MDWNERESLREEVIPDAQRSYFTEQEHELVSTEGTAFCRALAALTAEVLNKFEPEVREYVKVCLQDQTSLYSPFTADLILVRLLQLKHSASST